MKRNLAAVTTLTFFFFTALTLPVRLVAQEQQEQRDRKEHHRYKLIDLGTFGGPNSYLPEPNQAIRALNNRGVVAGGADTSTADPFWARFRARL